MHANMFDPALYAKVRQPVLAAETLPAWCYTSREFYEREVERVFRRVWNFVGRADEIPQPGDFMTIDLFGESLLIQRDDDGVVHAFVNICRHRGTRLLDGCGNSRLTRCPYHGWTYAADGSLIGTPGMEQTVGFNRKDYNLLSVRLETWAGYMFVNFDTNDGSLATYLGELPDKLASYNLDDMVCVRRKEYDLSCNWKIYIENAMEEYHTPVVHKKSIGKQTTVREVGRGEWAALFMKAERTIAVLPEDIGDAFPQIPTLAGNPAHGTHFIVIYPGTFFALTQDCMWWLEQRPTAPDRTKIVIGSCFPRSTVARPDFEQKVMKYYRRWDKALPEDNYISERQQLGISSSFSRPGRFSFQEPAVHDIANWVLDRVLDLPTGRSAT